MNLIKGIDILIIQSFSFLTAFLLKMQSQLQGITLQRQCK